MREREHLEDQGVDGRIILIWRAWTGSSWIRIGTGGGALVNAIMTLLFL